jgi:hypothetical protein
VVTSRDVRASAGARSSMRSRHVLEDAVGLGAEVERAPLIPGPFGFARVLGAGHTFEAVHARRVHVADAEVRVQRLFAGERVVAGFSIVSAICSAVPSAPRSAAGTHAATSRASPHRR